MTTHNDSVNRLSRIERNVFDEGYRINADCHRPFSYKDFESQYKHGTIRNAFQKLRRQGLIYLVYRTTIAFYAVRGSGIECRAPHEVTPDRTGDPRLLFESSC